MSEDGPQLYVNELCLSSKEELRCIMKLLSPEPYVEERHGMHGPEVSAIWAPDDTVVALHYNISDPTDVRGDQSGHFQVLSAIGTAMLQFVPCLQ